MLVRDKALRSKSHNSSAMSRNTSRLSLLKAIEAVIEAAWFELVVCLDLRTIISYFTCESADGRCPCERRLGLGIHGNWKFPVIFVVSPYEHVVTCLVIVPSSAYSAMASQLALVAYNAVFGRTMIHRACPAHFLHHFPCQRWRSVEFKVALTLCIAMNWDLGTDYILSGSYWTLLACLASA